MCYCDTNLKNLISCLFLFSFFFRFFNLLCLSLFSLSFFNFCSLKYSSACIFNIFFSFVGLDVCPRYIMANPKIVTNKPIMGISPKNSKGWSNAGTINLSPVNRIMKPKRYLNPCDALPTYSPTNSIDFKFLIAVHYHLVFSFQDLWFLNTTSIS